MLWLPLVGWVTYGKSFKHRDLSFPICSVKEMHERFISILLLILDMPFKANICNSYMRMLLHSYLTRTRISFLFIHFIYLYFFFNKISSSYKINSSI